MSIKDKIIELLERENPKTFEDFIKSYIYQNRKELSIMELSSIVINTSEIIRIKGVLSEHKKSLFEEQLKMTEMYLKGEMYSNEETARNMLSKQIENIELMQYTGLKDKNNIEIYEGDIVKILCKDEELFGTIKFGRKEYKWAVNNAYGFYIDFPNKELKSEIFYWIETYGIEVVENIYERIE